MLPNDVANDGHDLLNLPAGQLTPSTVADAAGIGEEAVGGMDPQHASKSNDGIGRREVALPR